MIDVVYALGNGSPYNNSELRYSLRSIEKHLKNFRHVYIIGELPSWINNVYHVPCDDTLQKEENILKKLLIAANIKEISNEFLFINDDHFLTVDTDACMFPYFFDGYLHQAINRASGAYMQTLINTEKTLRDKKLTTSHYDVHFPIRYKKQLIKQMCKSFAFSVPYSMAIKSIYCNRFGVSGVHKTDCKIRHKKDLKNLPEFFSVSDSGFDVDFFDRLYPNESHYEKSKNWIKSKNFKIGIGVTTHNRHDVALNSIKEIKKHTPNANIVIVDDASTPPARLATFRFETNVGIARAKNKCIELLSGCDYIFLFDDDTYPIVKEWELQYIKASLDTGNEHFMMTWNINSNGRSNGHNLINKGSLLSEYSSPCGCMLFLTKKVINTVGGMNDAFYKWGDEHVEYSNRIYNAGLTKARYLDLTNSKHLIHASDYFLDVPSSVDKETKVLAKNKNVKILKNNFFSSEFLPYSPIKNVVFASYFNYKIDVQRGEKWGKPLEKLMPLINSVKKNQWKLVIFHNGFDMLNIVPILNQYVTFLKVNPCQTMFPNMFRWIAYYDYLKNNHLEIENLFCVDSTDVEMKSNPIQFIKPNILYSGEEYNQTLTNRWMREYESQWVTVDDYQSIIDKNSDKILLNCGVIGGNIAIMTKFLKKLSNFHQKHSHNTGYSNDMAVYNYVMHKFFLKNIEHGQHITSKFKKYEEETKAWFKHK